MGKWNRIVWLVALGLLVACGSAGPGPTSTREPYPMGTTMMGTMEPTAMPPATEAPTATLGPAVAVSYKDEVQPIFNRYCVGCHGGSGGLYLDTYAHVMDGTPRGPVIVPNDPQGSPLVQAIKGETQPQMPLGGPPLSTADIETIVSWIAEGAPDN